MFEKIVLERTPCYGSCPAYRVEITGDGLVFYSGTDFVETFGPASWQLSPEQVEQLNSLIEKSYFAIQEREPKLMWSCSPSCITSVIMSDGRRRMIENDHGSDRWPRSLRRLENKIDKIIGVKAYIGSVQ